MSTKLRHLLALLALGAFLVSGCASSVASSTQNVCAPNVAMLNEPMPDFKGTLIDGSSVDLNTLKDGVVVYSVWGSWCGPCRKEAPQLVEAFRTLSTRSVAFMGIDVRDSRVNAANFEREFSLPFSSIFDESSSLAADLKVPSPPATLVAKDGRIRARILGGTDAKTISCVVTKVEEPH